MAKRSLERRARNPGRGVAWVGTSTRTGQKAVSFEEGLDNIEIVSWIYKLRTNAGFSQRQLAAKVGTTASVICRLEDADYKGHSLLMLTRIAAVLNKRIEIRFVSAGRKIAVA